MRIIIITDWFSENMGYAENLLPKFLALQKKDVHLITSTAQIYYNSPFYAKTYESYLGPAIVAPCVKELDGYILHRLPLDNNKKLTIQGLQKYLHTLKPDIIQTFVIYNESTFESAKYCHKTSTKLFTASHIHASVFNTEDNRFKSLKGKIQLFFRNREIDFINKTTVTCYPIAKDAANIAINYFRVPENKIKIQSLGVDTSIFFPAPENFQKEQKAKLRKDIGIDKEDLVCIYTGRFAPDKKPYCLANTIDYLCKQGKKVKGLFVGKGTPDEINYIRSKEGCIVKDFVPLNELPKFYWIADIGVWPAQESTSQLDAAACGLPLILSNKIQVYERINGNGLLYEEGNEKELANVIMELNDNKKRIIMRKIGIKKIKNNYSWEKIAKDRIVDYSTALKSY